MIDESYQTLTQPIIQRSETDPSHLALVFIEDDGSEHPISSAGFHREVVLYAQALQASGVQADDLVILVLQHSQTLLYAFWGAIYLGAIASIFPYLTEKLDPEIYMERVKALVTHSQARAVITFPEFKDDLSRLLAQTGVKVLSTAEVPQGLPALPDGPVLPGFTADKIAFLQHSSGTTGLQKGVALSHRAVLNQIRAYSQAIGLNAQDVVVSWLPLYHDMGLDRRLCHAAGVRRAAGADVAFQVGARSKVLLMQAIHDTMAHCAGCQTLPTTTRAAIRAREICRAWICPACGRSSTAPSRSAMDSHQVFLEQIRPVWAARSGAVDLLCNGREHLCGDAVSASAGTRRVDWVSRRALQERGMADPAGRDPAGSTPMVSCGCPIPGTQIVCAGPAGPALAGAAGWRNRSAQRLHVERLLPPPGYRPPRRSATAGT